MDYPGGKTAVDSVTPADQTEWSSACPSPPGEHAAPHLVGANGGSVGGREAPTSVEEIEATEKGWFAYFRTRNFYVVLVLGYELHCRSFLLTFVY